MKRTAKQLIALAMLALPCGWNATQVQAQTPENGEANSEKVEWITYQGEHYTIAYPSILEESYSDKDILNASLQDDEYCFLSVNYGDEGPTLEELPELAENYVYMKEHHGCKSETSIIDGKLLIIKSTCTPEPDEDEEEAETDEDNVQTVRVTVEYYFVLMKENRVCVLGSYTFNQEDAAKYEPYFQPILQSININ